MKNRLRRTIVLAACLGWAGSLSAEPAAVSEPALLRKMPRRVLEKLASGGRPDAEGLVGHNRGRWLHVGAQRGAMLYLSAAAALSEREHAERAWAAVDAAFARQTPAGNFELGNFQGRTPRRSDDLSGVSFWLAELCHALVVLRQSELRPQFEDRLNALRPKIERAAWWLVDGRAELERYDAGAPNRLFFDANAFRFLGILLEDQRLSAIGTEFLARGLRAQRADGVFVEKGGHDSSYQAVALLKLLQHRLHFPDERLDAAIERGMRWELARIGPDGQVSVAGNTRTGAGQEKFLGRPKDVNYAEVLLGTLYFAALHDDQPAREAAERLVAYVSKRPAER
ncbi:MAG: hypothetical protein HY549_13345 [Elusimicrobia bacterium]|nr:hypothetical protein [Elusimicrobiota bacterium]